MGNRGPQPKPTVLKIIEGNKGKRPLDLNGIHPEISVPSAPKELCPQGLKEWKRITPELVKLGLISKLDRGALFLYCQAFGRLMDYEHSFQARVKHLMEKSGFDYATASEELSTARTPKGFAQQSVLIQLINRQKEQVNKYLQAFGLSPSARGRIQPSKNDGQGSLFPDDSNGWSQLKKP
jgi:P27 family predicted phage terminase small subunit